MRQHEAIHVLTETLRHDEAVRAIFLKGSFGRKEGDEHSDVDLYAMVPEDELDAFLTRRRAHLAAYRPILLEDEIHIIAPQLIVVYDNFLHVDLFTVTEARLYTQDEIVTLYDPDELLRHHPRTLTLTDHDLFEHAFDAIWFFFQYTKARDRGNDVWAVDMLRQGMIHFAYVLAAHHDPSRAALGLKDAAVRDVIPLREWYEALTPSRHPIAAKRYIAWLEEEQVFFETMSGFNRLRLFYDQLIQREKSRPH
ncbi:nucleotidyltransferase domain-containing protein [Exiguobacterium sp.]|uniref:nucleotidyltransferase domain-containing protein n=1 Tax=Exiguobacterium sp. TaxID=44751 RepID=UPI00263A3D7B|nr:nucleotidyltransferase domain-containing protein [Exiguobacterium sp.]MCC5891366.1 nucleotidyltransferase domain-containing protein [Exiguobacterium sp.]